MNKLDVLEHRNIIISKILLANQSNIESNQLQNLISIEKKEYTNSVFDKCTLVYKSYLFDNEYKLFSNKKLLISDEIFKITYLFQYHREKDKLSVYIIEAGVKKNKNSYYYSTTKTHVLTIGNNGKLYCVNKYYNKPVLSNFKNYSASKNKFKSFNYINSNLIIKYSNTYNNITSYYFSTVKNSVICKFNDVANAKSIEELLDNTVRKIFCKKLCDDNDINILLYCYYKLNKKSINYINNTYERVIKDLQDNEIYFGQSDPFYQYLNKITNYPYMFGFVNLYFKYGRKLDITDYENSIQKCEISSNKYYFNNKLKSITSEPFKFKNISRYKNIKKYLKSNIYKFKVVKVSNDSEFIDFIKNNIDYSIQIQSYFNSSTLFLKVYKQKELIDIVYTSSLQHYYSIKKKNYVLDMSDVTKKEFDDSYITGCFGDNISPF
jgi:hypothetical protein